MKKPLLYLLVLLVAVFSTSCTQSSKGTFEVGDKTFLLNGEPFVVKAAEIHYPRIPKEYWEHRIKMSKALGMNTICLYVFWNFHEPEEGKYDFYRSEGYRCIFAAWHKKTECTSLYVPDLTFAQNGKWADYLGGC